MRRAAPDWACPACGTLTSAAYCPNDGVPFDRVSREPPRYRSRDLPVAAEGARGELVEAHENQDAAPLLWPWAWWLVIALILIAEAAPWVQRREVPPRLAVLGLLLLVAALLTAVLWYTRRDWLRVAGRYLQRGLWFLTPRRQRRLVLEVQREGYGRTRMVLVDPAPWPRETRAAAAAPADPTLAQSDPRAVERERLLDGVRVYYTTPGRQGAVLVERIEAEATDSSEERPAAVWSGPGWGAVGPFALLGVYLATRAVGWLS